MLQEQQCEDDMVIREPLTNETTGEKFKGLLLKLCKKWWFWVVIAIVVIGFSLYSLIFVLTVFEKITKTK